MRGSRFAVKLFVAAVLLRAAVILTASIHAHLSLSTLAAKGDGASYIAYARAMLGDSSALTEYDRRVFPGYPALIAAVHITGLPFPIAALVVDWICAGAAAAMAGVLFGRRVGVAMLFLLPHYLCNSSMAMSEAPLLAFTLAGLLLARRDRGVAGGIMLGLAMLIRPMACFAAGACILSLPSDREIRISSGFSIHRSLRILLPAALVVIGGLVAMHLFTGDAFRGVKIYRDSPQAYVGQIFQWPFHSLIVTPGREHVSAGLVVYIYVHVAIVLYACGSLARRVFRSPQSLDCFALIWLVANTIFQLCIGSGWGFRHFPRFAIPAQPALFWALRDRLPRNKWIWFAGAAGVFVLAVVSVEHSA